MMFKSLEGTTVMPPPSQSMHVSPSMLVYICTLSTMHRYLEIEEDLLYHVTICLSPLILSVR